MNNPATEDRAYINASLLWFGLGLAAIALALVIRDPFFRETWRYSLQGAGLFLIFNYVLRTEGFINRSLSITSLKWVGDRSYVLYLIHMPMLLVGERLVGANAAGHLFGFARSAAFAAAMFRFVERRLFKWRQGYQARLRVAAAMQPKGVE